MKRFLEALHVTVLGAPGRDLFQIRVCGYIDDTTFTINVGICTAGSAIWNRAMKSGDISERVD